MKPKYKLPNAMTNKSDFDTIKDDLVNLETYITKNFENNLYDQKIIFNEKKWKIYGKPSYMEKMQE